MTGDKIDFIALDGPRKINRLLLVNQPCRRCVVMGCTSSLFNPSS